MQIEQCSSFSKINAYILLEKFNIVLSTKKYAGASETANMFSAEGEIGHKQMKRIQIFL